MKRNENFWSYRLHNLGTPKVLRTDGQTDGRTDRRTAGRSGPTTRPAFAKATQVKKHENLPRRQRVKTKASKLRLCSYVTLAFGSLLNILKMVNSLHAG